MAEQALYTVEVYITRVKVYEVMADDETHAEDLVEAEDPSVKLVDDYIESTEYADTLRWRANKQGGHNV